MSISIVDSHCHLDRLDLNKLGSDMDSILDMARQHDVTHFLCVCIDLDNFPDVTALADRYPQVFASVGVHPNEQDARDPEVVELVKLSKQDKVVAIGETGLDYFHSKGDLEWQRQRFRRHIRAARECNKPLIIHSRAAKEDTINIMREEGAAKVGGVMHCFTEDWDMAQKAMELNFYISFSGIVTFRNADELREVARLVPLEKMLVETDAPYLTPVPYRGKCNQPAYVRFVVEHIAELRNESLETIARITKENFFKLFRDAVATT
jgi:TatD DNase family protein